jgi:hypothetical protein
MTRAPLVAARARRLGLVLERLGHLNDLARLALWLDVLLRRRLARSLRLKLPHTGLCGALLSLGL